MFEKLGPAQPVSAGDSSPGLPALSAGFDIDCAWSDLKDAIQRKINDSPALSGALKACGEKIHTIRLTPTDGPLSLQASNGEIQIFYPDKRGNLSKIIPQVEQLIFRRAVVESAIVSLKAVIDVGECDTDKLTQLKDFLRESSPANCAADNDPSRILRTIVESDLERLGRRLDPLAKKLQRDSEWHLTSTEEAKRTISALRDITLEALAIVKLRELPSSEKQIARANRQVVTQVERALGVVASSLDRMWAQILFSGDPSATQAIIDLRQQFATELRLPGFNTPAPPPFSSPPLRPTTVSFGRSGSWSGGNPFPRRFNTSGARQPTSSSGEPTLRLDTDIVRAVSSATPRSHATIEYDRKLREWEISDPDPLGYLRERILDIIPKVPGALKTLRDSKPRELPIPVTELIESICLLRFTSGTDGLALFGWLACQFTETELEKISAVQAQLLSVPLDGPDCQAAHRIDDHNSCVSNLVANHPADYVQLVEFVAIWPLLKSEDQREAYAEQNLSRLTTLTTKALYTITRTLEESFCNVVQQDKPFDAVIMQGFRKDLIGLSEAASVLGNAEICRYVESTTAVLLDLLTACEVGAMPDPKRLSKLNPIEDISVRCSERCKAAAESGPRTVPKSTVVVVAQYVDTLRDELRAALSTYSQGLATRLKEADSTGNTQAMLELISEALEVQAECSDEQARGDIVRNLNIAALSWTNNIAEYLEEQVAECLEALQNERDWVSVLSKFLPEVEANISHAMRISDLFRTNKTPHSAVRINHVDRVVTGTREALAQQLLSDELALTGFLRHFNERLDRDPKSTLSAMTLFIASLPLTESRINGRDLRNAYQLFMARAQTRR